MSTLNTAPVRLALSSVELATVRSLLQRYLPGLEVRAFGSRARGSAKPSSDLDLLIISEAPLSPRSLALLADEFAESDLPFKVDVVESCTAAPAFLQQILDRSIAVQLGSLEGSGAVRNGQRHPA